MEQELNNWHIPDTPENRKKCGLTENSSITVIKQQPGILLGHFNIKTTERYLHVSKKALVNIISPLDDLYAGNKIDWLTNN